MLKNFGPKSLSSPFKSTMLMKFLFLFLLLPIHLFAQDITGVWVGKLYNDTTRNFIKYELAISEYHGKLSGYSHTIFIIDRVENIGVKSLKIKKSGKTFLVEDDKLVYNNYSAPPAKGVKTYSELTFSQNDSEMILSGPWITNRTKVFKSLTGNIFLRKKKNIKESLIIAKLEILGLTGTLSFMNTPDQSNDFAFANKPVSYLTKPEKSDKEIANNLVSNTKEPANSNLQQAEKKEQIVKQAPEVILDKNESENAKTGIKGLTLKVADKPTKEEEKIDVILPESNSTKSEPKQIKVEGKGGEKVPVEVQRKEDIGLNKSINKEASTILTETPKRKNEATNTVSIKSENHQIVKQPVAENENRIIPLKKDSNATDKKLTISKQQTSKEIPIQKFEVKNIASIKSTDNQIGKEEKKDKEIPIIAQKKDSIVSDNILLKTAPQTVIEGQKQKKETVKNVTVKSVVEKVDKLQKLAPVRVLKNNNAKDLLSKEAQIAIPKSEPTNIVSIKSVVQQIERKEKEDKKIPVNVLKKDSIVSNMTVINAAPHAAAEIAKRTIETIKSVEIKSDSLLLTLYDNGVVDGDTVSVLLNGKVIMPMQGLSTKAINKTIYLTPEMGDSIVLIMYAENLGSIPPNTGLLVVHDGEEIYEIRFSGDLEKNAAIILKRKKKK